MRTITPCLWFDGQAEAAARLYVSVFPNSTLGEITRYGEAGPGPRGGVMTVAFELDGQPMLGLNGGPEYRFSEAVSFQVHCETQAEVDRYWTALSAGGEEGPCGWLKDRFGLSWQVVPNALPRLLGDPDPERARRTAEAMFKMGKLDIAALEAAAAG
jgi:predicted 3-demethylubiquinone-9 3-methyltransferase (glyoxalase superfamily)